MEAYADFWYRIVNGKNLTVSGAFKKAFGEKLKNAWHDFESHYEVPEIPDNPVRAGLAQDFFQPDSSSYSQFNDSGSLYSSLTAAGGKLVWMDRLGGRVFAADEGDVPVFRYMFSQRGLSDLHLSNDGRFLALNYISINNSAEKARIKIYDFSNKSFYSVKEKGLREGSPKTLSFEYCATGLFVVPLHRDSRIISRRQAAPRPARLSNRIF